MKTYDQLTPDEIRICGLAIGRIFRIGSRPARPGDLAEYERCRKIVMDIYSDDSVSVSASAPRPGWNFGRGATGVVE